MAENRNLEIVKQRVFEYLVIKHPTVAEAEDGGVSQIIVPLKQICATDERAATLRANRDIPEAEMKYDTRLEVVVRPFEKLVVVEKGKVAETSSIPDFNLYAGGGVLLNPVTGCNINNLSSLRSIRPAATYYSGCSL